MNYLYKLYNKYQIAYIKCVSILELMYLIYEPLLLIVSLYV